MPMTFPEAVASIPADINRVHHGRDFDGVDCLGLVLLIYELVGRPFNDLDIPYGERDHLRPHRFAEVARRLDRRFQRIEVTGVWRDGDILMIGDLRRNHLGLYCSGMAYQMLDRLTISRADLVSPLVVMAWRQREVV